MADLDKNLLKWYEQVEKTAKLASTQKAKITGAGAESFEKSLNSKSHTK